MKPPKNFYNAVDRRKLGLEDGLLPDVTTADNGKILGVTDGKWNPISGAGTEVFTVAITYDSEQEEYSADKTHAQIVTAIAGGSIVLATYDGRTYVYAGSGKESAGSPVYFSYIQADSESQMLGKVFEIDEDEKIVYSEHDITEGLIPIRAVDTVTLTAGNTSVTVSDIAITADSIFDIYTDTFGVNPTAASVSTGSLTLTFEAQASDVSVKVVIR